MTEMTELTDTRAPVRSRTRIAVLATVIVAGAVFIAANAHLVIVSLASQPDCVPHVKTATEGAAFRAAKSSC